MDVDARPHARQQPLGPGDLDPCEDLLPRLELLVAEVHFAVGRRLPERAGAGVDRIEHLAELHEALALHPAPTAHRQRPGHFVTAGGPPAPAVGRGPRQQSAAGTSSGALVDRHVLEVPLARVHLAGAGDLLLGIVDHLEPL